MTMGLSDTSAQKVINTLTETQLKLIIIFKIFGEEKGCFKNCKNIVKARLTRRRK